MQITAEKILPDIKMLCDFEDTEAYDTKLLFLIEATMKDMTIEGVKEIDEDSEYLNSYVIAISYRILNELDPDNTKTNYKTMYNKLVTTLRLQSEIKTEYTNA